MKIIFLDIDGVMKPGRCYFDKTLSRNRDGGFDPLAVSIVNRLCEKTGAGIVFNTTWNHRFNTMDKAKEFALINGLLGRVYGKTIYPNGERRAAIAHWLNMPENIGQFDSWVALDDCPSIQGENAVLVDGENGISIQNYRDAVKILGGDDAFMVLM